MSYEANNISLIRANVNSSSFDSGVITSNASLPYSNLFYPFLLDNGGNYLNTALTIDNLKNFQKTYLFPNEDWVSNNRLRDNLMLDQSKWGFRETNHAVKFSKAISNAFCFADQTLSFYIATQGHETGYIGNQWVYCQTSIDVSSLDIITGDLTELCSFSNFNSSLWNVCY
jgi:hypothetical protein